MELPDLKKISIEDIPEEIQGMANILNSFMESTYDILENGFSVGSGVKTKVLNISLPVRADLPYNVGKDKIAGVTILKSSIPTLGLINWEQKDDYIFIKSIANYDGTSKGSIVVGVF